MCAVRSEGGNYESPDNNRANASNPDRALRSCRPHHQCVARLSRRLGSATKCAHQSAQHSPRPPATRSFTQLVIRFILAPASLLTDPAQRALRRSRCTRRTQKIIYCLAAKYSGFRTLAISPSRDQDLPTAFCAPRRSWQHALGGKGWQF